MNLLSLAQSGMNAAESALIVTGNNINNLSTPEYSKQDVILGEAGGKNTSYGFFGYGVQVDAVQRANDNYINHRIRDAESDRYFINGGLQQIGQIDDMFAHESQRISSEFDKIFTTLQKMSSDPVSFPAREETLAQFNSLCGTFHRNSKTLDRLLHESNGKIEQSVNEINVSSQQIATLNAEIEKNYATTKNLPADLLDKRDALLETLSGQTAIRVHDNPVTGRMSVTLTNGLTIVNGDRANRLAVMPAADDLDAIEVHHLDPADNSIPLTAENIVSGKLAGLLKFCQQDLPSVYRVINQQALHIAHEFNTINTQGFTSDGQHGSQIFNIPQPSAQANSNNMSQATLNVRYENINNITSKDYKVTYSPDNSNAPWTVIASDDNEIGVETTVDGKLRFDGLEITPVGMAQPGESFLIKPLMGVAKNIAVAITDGKQIAASRSADIEDESNNENIKDFLNLKEKKIIRGSTLNDSYAALVSSTGSMISILKVNAQTTQSVCDNLKAQKQSLIGVNVNEEYINMTLFTQYYQANAQVLKSSIALFDIILNIR